MENVEKLNKGGPESNGKATSALFAGRHDRTQTKKPSARCRAKKVAQRTDVESVHLYRIDKTEIFA